MLKKTALQTYQYDLPEALIATTPLRQRDQSRLMVVNRSTRQIAHHKFTDLLNDLPQPSLIVLNDSKVIPARLLGHKARSDGQVEIFVLKPSPGHPGCYETLLRPLKKIRNKDLITFAGSDLTAEIIDRDQRIVRFNHEPLYPHLEKIGHMPLPPYIKRDDTATDRKTYQTVYAKHQGSVAAPTAGLHFTKPLLKQLKDQGHQVVTVTLHISYATFRPVEAQDIRQHQMHCEQYSLSPQTLQTIQSAKNTGRPVIAVGTTSCRVLESVARTGQASGSTDLFLYPGKKFHWIDHLITNFHLPLSSLLMLIYAFGSTPLMRKAYQEAIKTQYRFYSYGDAMLIL